MPLFFICCGALLTACFLLGSTVNDPPRSSPRQPPIATRSLRPRASPPRPAIAPGARRFLTAFLRYEVGDMDPRVLEALRATTTPAFAVQLLDGPAPRPTDIGASAPHLGPIAVAQLSANPPLVSVTATADRPSGPEQLSFVFTLRVGRWLASAPGA